MRYRFYIALGNDWKEVSRTEYNSFKGRKLRAPFYCTQEQLDELWKHKLEEKKQKRKKKQYYISGMSLVNGSWQTVDGQLRLHHLQKQHKLWKLIRHSECTLFQIMQFINV